MNMMTKQHRKWIKPVSVALLIIILFIVAGINIPRFLSLANILNVMRQNTTIALLSLGMTMVIVAKGIDLSVGGLLAFCAMLNGIMMNSGFPLVMTISVSIIAGAALGLFNGVMVEKLEVPAFITTMVIGQVAIGLSLMISEGQSLGGFSPAYVFIGNGMLFGIPVSNYIAIAFLAISVVILTRTPLGTHIYALGGNSTVVKQQGISTAKINYFVFTFSGICAAIAGIVLSAQMNTIHPTQGSTLQLDAVAACVIGGVNLAGGEGKVYMAFLGALLIGFLRNALNLLGMHPYYQNLIVGIIIIAIVAISMLNRNKKIAESQVF